MMVNMSSNTISLSGPEVHRNKLIRLTENLEIFDTKFQQQELEFMKYFET